MTRIAAAGVQRSVKSAARVLDILDCLALRSSGASFVQLGRELAIPKSSLHALLEVMTERGYLELDDDSRTYKLGLRVWEVGQTFPRQHSVLEIAGQVLRDTVDAVNETAQLARLDGRDNVYLVKVDSTHMLRLQSETGSRLSAHATGVGKALLAELSDAEITARFGSGALETYTATTHATADALLEEIHETQRRGFAIDNEEYTPGVFCLAVPIHDQGGAEPIAISVSLPVTRATPERLALALAVIAGGSVEISRRIGAAEKSERLIALSDPGNAAAAIDALVRSNRYSLSFAV